MWKMGSGKWVDEWWEVGELLIMWLDIAIHCSWCCFMSCFAVSDFHSFNWFVFVSALSLVALFSFNLWFLGFKVLTLKYYEVITKGDISSSLKKSLDFFCHSILRVFNPKRSSHF